MNIIKGSCGNCGGMAEALKFYRDGWRFKTLKNRAGLEWFPKEELLDDCGNKAREALAAYTLANKPNGLCCHSCGRPYSNGPDLVVSDENWKKIEPKGGGVLCPNCMNDAFEALGAPYGSIEAAFTSGPFANKNWKKPSADEPASQPSQREAALVKAAQVLRAILSNQFPPLDRSERDAVKGVLAAIGAYDTPAKPDEGWS